MFDLTPSERRGALVLLALVALGACADLWRREPAPTPPPAERTPGAPGPGAAAAPPVAAGPLAVPAGPLDLNTASAAELDRLPGIGPVLAGRIVAQREAHGPFRSAEDLLAVPGIGPRLYEKLAPLVTARAPAAPQREPVRNARTAPR